MPCVWRHRPTTQLPTPAPAPTWEGDLVCRPLLQQQPVAAVKEEDAERAVQAPRWRRLDKAVAVVLVGRPLDDVTLVHHDAVVPRHEVRLAALACGGPAGSGARERGRGLACEQKRRRFGAVGAERGRGGEARGQLRRRGARGFARPASAPRSAAVAGPHLPRWPSRPPPPPRPSRVLRQTAGAGADGRSSGTTSGTSTRSWHLNNGCRDESTTHHLSVGTRACCKCVGPRRSAQNGVSAHASAAAPARKGGLGGIHCNWPRSATTHKPYLLATCTGRPSGASRCARLATRSRRSLQGTFGGPRSRN